MVRGQVRALRPCGGPGGSGRRDPQPHGAVPGRSGPTREQLRNPRRVHHIGLAARGVPQMLGVDHPYQETIFQDPGDRFPWTPVDSIPASVTFSGTSRSTASPTGRHRGGDRRLRPPHATPAGAARRGHHRVPVYVRAGAPLDRHIHPAAPFLPSMVGAARTGNRRSRNRDARSSRQVRIPQAPRHTFLRAQVGRAGRPDSHQVRAAAPAGMITFSGTRSPSAADGSRPRALPRAGVGPGVAVRRDERLDPVGVVETGAGWGGPRPAPDVLVLRSSSALVVGPSRSPGDHLDLL